MTGATKVTIAGAGALGLSCALALADAGFAVTVCDPAEPVANASGVAGGMLAPAFEAALDPVSAGDLDVLLAARDLWPALAERAGVALDRSGALAVGPDGWLAEVRASFTRLGLHLAEMPRATLDAVAPGLSPRFDRALLCREDWRLEPAQALASLRSACADAGVSFRRDAVTSKSDGLLVIATGAGQALADLAPEVAALTPIKGHILRLEGVPAGPFAIRGRGAYAVATETGTAVGATMETGVSDPAVEAGQEAGLREAGARLIPAAAAAPGRLLAGVRAATDDGLPLVGPSAASEVILAVGARRNGWLLAPLVAKVVTAYARGVEPGRFADRLDPTRFAPGRT